ncbi:hypothetical protein ACX12L_19725 [Alicycliphilus sp. T452]
MNHIIMTNQIVFESQEQHLAHHIGSVPDVLHADALTQDLSGHVLTSPSAELAGYMSAMEDVDAALLADIASARCALYPLAFTHSEAAIRSSEVGALVGVVKHMSEEMSWPRPICHAALVSTEDINGVVRPYIAPQGRPPYAASDDSLVVILPQELGNLEMLEALAGSTPGAFNHLDVSCQANTAYLGWVARRDADQHATEVWLQLDRHIGRLVDSACNEGRLIPIAWVGVSHVVVGGWAPNLYAALHCSLAKMIEEDHDATVEFGPTELCHAAEAAAAIGPKPWQHDIWPETEYSSVVQAEIVDFRSS